MQNYLLLSFFVVVIIISGCASTEYRIIKKSTGEIVQTVKADSPAGESASIVVYLGTDKSPIIKAGVDSSDLVNATAVLGRKAVGLALKIGAVKQ